MQPDWICYLQALVFVVLFLSYCASFVAALVVRCDYPERAKKPRNIALGYLILNAVGWLVFAVHSIAKDLCAGG